ncbi:unnamed protein product [Symbiodinium sp. CCMP2592]|nr:unnamed protein product [Symbiodinium sp. CCMP2592]
MPHAVRLLISLAAVAQQGGGWWLHSNVTNQTGADAGPRDESKWAQLREWVVSHANVGSDWAAWLTWPDAQGVPERMWSWDSGLCMVLDTAVSFIGWMLFGNSWPGVRTGCQRIFRLLALLLLCMGAHYLWALCWPVLSLISVVVMGVVWLVRAIVRKLGTLVYWAQQAAGGVPEASDAEFLGPGTGRIPETADLRAFKKVGGADKWILIRRGGHVAVFKAGSDSQTIRTPGLFVPVEPDTMRGDKEIVEACQGYDKIHLCRNLVCNEEGQHFKEYGVARDFDGERFHLKNAELGAAKAGRALWSWLWASPARPPKPLKEFGSESETEPAKACGAHRVAWADLAGDCSLATQPCRMPGTTFCDLLFEDRFDDLGRVDLCPQHALDYERRRRPQQCHHNGCAHVGILGESGDGVRRCRLHTLGEVRKPSSRRRSPARPPQPVQDDPEEPELPPRGHDGAEGLRDLKRLLAEVKSEGGEPEKRVRGSSPGRTPRSSIQKNLAKLGLLDSPAKEHPLPVLEEFFNQYAEGRDAGLSEEDVRVSIAAERGQTLKEVTKELVRAAIVEQEKGQRGLTKFLKAWQKPSSTRGSSPASVARGSSAPSWDLVETSPEKPPSLQDRAPGPLRIGNPGIFGVEDRKAGATDSGAFDEIARAIQSQTAEIASLVKSHTENTAVPPGTIKGLNRTSEELVFLLRACNQYQVTVGAGEQGQALANALLSAQVGASTKLRRAGFKQKVTSRLAIGLAGPYWGTQEKHALNATDFVAHTDAELDAFVQELRSSKAGPDQRPQPPSKLEDWEGRVRRQNDVWALVYGSEWKPVRTHALERLLEWHQAEPHKWPLTVLMDVWEELHWRFFEELKETLRLLKKEAGRETMSLPDIKFYALMPNASGTAWLELPGTFDLRFPDGWFMTEVLPRIERKQERMLWRLTWEGTRSAKPSTHAGGEQKPDSPAKPTVKVLWGPKLSTEEVNKAKERAPLDQDGLLLCWGALTHMGCSNTACGRSHSELRGKFEALDPCVQMQLLRRGGLRRMRPETKDSVTEKIKALRVAVVKDKAAKTTDRKSGQGDDVQAPGETRAGGEKVVQFEEIPDEFGAVDYTAAEEDLREALKGPDRAWLQGGGEANLTAAEVTGESAPQEAKDLVARAEALANGPVLGQLRTASDDLFAWAATRVAMNPHASLEEILGEMATYGMGEMAAEATDILEAQCGARAGSTGGIQVTEVVWEPGRPGRATATIEGATWTIWDYREEVRMSEELASMLQQPEEGAEKRQCVTKAIAAGIMWRQRARQPSPREVEEKALELRLEQTRLALEAQAVMGEPAQKVAPIEAEIRIYTHDTVRANHDKDFRSLAVFPLAELEDCKLVVIRADYKGDVVVETVTGPLWRDGGWTLWTLIWRGHMVFLEPPPGMQAEVFLDRWQPYDTPALGFLFFWHTRHDQERTSPGVVQCRLCRGRKAGEAVVHVRRESNLAAAAIVGCIRAGSRPNFDKVSVRGASLCFQEVFAGAAVMTAAWAAAGIKVLEPVELWADPVNRVGYRPDHDLTKGEVQKRLLYLAGSGDANVWWIASPCTSFCDWCAQNGGTRTFQCPWGGQGDRPHKEVELQGNTLSKVGAELFLNALRNGAFPIAESSGKSGRYPKMWDLPWWREILRRPDVQFVEFPMCAFGLGPPDGEGYYHHRTRLVFPRCEAFAAALSRCCPGVGAAHRHVPLAGARPGAAQSRCAEAGVYPQEFVRTVVSTLQQVLVAGGEDSRPQWPVAEETRAGSDECDVGPWAPHWASRAGGDVSGRCGGRSGWLHELDDDYVEGCEGTIGFAGDFPTGGWVVNGEDTRAGSAERYEAPTEEAKIAAQTYIELTGKGGPGCPEAWKRVCDGGARLVQEAGSVKLAAESLWAVREEKGLNNLKGVDDSRLDTVLHPDLLEYLRDVRRRGLAARFVGERKRCQAKVHPNGRRNLAQVYRQIWKDVCKLRVLVVPAGLEMGPVISSPFDAVDKMLPDRSIAPDKRIVHDQRVINEGTHKEWHPPSVQPRHEQIARLVLFAKCQLPGVEVLMSKKDVAGAFRLLWVDPRDAELFAGDLPWVPEEMEEGDTATGEGMTIVYLVSSFGFSGSPGEWTMWGKATEEFLRRHCPAKPRRDLAWAFESRILVDDNVLVEPLVGLRPWVASEVYELGVKTLLGDAAVNREKDLVEGPFRTFQTVWGLDMDTATEEIHLPERRILKGAHLLSDGAFEYGCKDLTVRAVQRFRGLATGWTVIVRGLKNELKAADRFLGGGGDGGAKVCPKLAVPGDAEECEQAWRDLWELFEESRWLCARPETWPTKFGASMRELLPIRERLALPGEWDAGTVFVSSDATKVMIAAIDWTSGSVMRMKAKAAAEWVQRCGEEDEVAIHVAEMLSFLAFACQVGESWQGKIVLYGGDNKIVKEWIVGRKAGTRVGRLLVRVINLLEMRFRFALVATWWRTFHNVHADLLTRCSDEEFDAIVKDKGWEVVDVTDALRQAMIDSERFGPCLRLKRAVPHTIAPKWSDFRAVELCGPDRVVKDFVEAAIAAGGQGRSSSWSGPVFPAEVVFASLPPDLHAKVILTASRTAIEGKAQLVIFEGPRQVPWEKAARLFERAMWDTEVCEFLTTEFGELAARRRKCMVAAPHGSVQGLFVANTSRGTLAPPMSAVLGDARSTSVSQWIYPDTILVDSGIPREPLLPLLKGHYWVKGERHVLMSTSGPLRWPLCENGKIQQCVVWEPRGPPGAVRLLTEAEVWLCQGRRPTAWDQLRGEGHEPGFLLREGSKATGGQTAAALVLMAGYSVSSDARAGGVWDSWDDANLAKVLEWLRRWKRGLLSRAAGQEDDRRAGGCEPRVHEGGRAGEKDGDSGSYIKKVTVWRWGDVLWLPASSSEDEAEDDPRRAGAPRGGTRRGKAEAAHGAAQVHIEPGPVRPFTGEVGAHVEECVEDNLCGYLADSTAKQYAGIYSKWRAWSARQGWPTEFLDKSEPVEANENKLLGFLGYLGWLGNSVASLKQAVFAIKDGHKRGGQGDPTEKMHRLWMLLGALDKRAPKRPRRLGVTPGMLKWIAEEMGPHLAATAEERFDSIMVLAALNTAWFFMLRAKEYCESNGVDYAMIMRGVDLKIECDEKGEAFVTLQFRKTKTDQEAFGTCKTMYASGVKDLCVVEALLRFRGIAPQRFGHGGEALKPLFRWANGQMLKRTQVQYLLQQAAAGVGLPPGRFMSHSLRIGGASALFQATGEIEVVKRTGRWSSSAVQRYLHDGETALKQAASKMASVEQRVHYT